MDKKAYNKLIKARTQLLVQQPFFGCLALHLELVECPDPAFCNTMAVDGLHMYWHPPFVHSLTEQELLGVIAHEVLHCAYMHMTRRGHRDGLIWNFAGDYVINDDLLKANFTLPKARLHDPQYAGMSTEEVYERIFQQLQKQKQAGGSGDGKDDNGGKKGQGPGGLQGQDKGGCGGVWDASPGGDKAEADKVAREWEATVRMAVGVAKASNAGQLPGHLQRLAKQLHEPKVSWRDLTRPFIDQSMTKDYAWSRPNRRFLANDLILPGFVADALNHLVMILDVSGSVTQRMHEAFVSEGAGALDDGVADKLTMIYTDTKVQRVDEFMNGDIVELKELPGGGGTDFDAVFKWVKENAQDASCVVFLTDMQTSSFGEEPPCPVLWGAYCPKQYLSHYVPPFGTVIHVESPE